MRQHLTLAWVSFAFLVFGASPAHYWLDSGEITAAGAGLGVMHPPGTPGLAPLLHLAGLVPLGSLGFRLSLVSCALAAGAIVALAVLLRRRDTSWPVIWGAALWVMAGLTFVRSARVVEIYALSGALAMVFLCGFDPRAPTGRMYGRLLGTAAAVVAAWSFGDLRLILAPVVFVLWVRDWGRKAPWTRWAPLVVALASLCVLTLPIASANGPVADWGNPESFGHLWSHLQAEPIRAAFADEILPASLSVWSVHAASFGERLVEDLGPLGPIVLLGAIASWWRQPEERGLLLVLLLMFAAELFYAVGVNPMGGADRQTGFWLGLVCALLVGAATQRWSERLGRARWAMLPLVGIALVLPAFLTSASDARVTRSWMPHAWTRDALAQAPPGATLLTQSDDLSAGLLAARVVEGARPDLATVPAQHLHKDPPDQMEDRESQVWEAASHAGSESARIIDVLNHAPRPPAAVGLELPQTGVFEALPFVARWGRPPLGFSGRHRPMDRTQAVEGVFDRWESEIESREDASRLARVVDATIRGWIGAGTNDANLLALAEASYLRVLTRSASDDVGTLLSLAAVKDATGDGAEAVTLARRALALEPGRNGALLSLALFLSRDPTGLPEARELAERSVELRPHLPGNWRRLSQIAGQQGDSEVAREAHDIATDLRRDGT